MNQTDPKKTKQTDYSGLSVFKKGQQFDWEALLALFLIVILVVVLFSLRVFLGVRAGNIFKDDFVPVVHDNNIDREVLDKVVKNFEAKADNLKKLQSNRPVFIDPSL